jgi:hypothetical protein
MAGQSPLRQVLSDLARSASKHMNDNWVQILQEQRQRNPELPARNMDLVERHSGNTRLTGTGKTLCVLTADGNCNVVLSTPWRAWPAASQ